MYKTKKNTRILRTWHPDSIGLNILTVQSAPNVWEGDIVGAVEDRHGRPLNAALSVDWVEPRGAASGGRGVAKAVERVAEGRRVFHDAANGRDGAHDHQHDGHDAYSVLHHLLSGRQGQLLHRRRAQDEPAREQEAQRRAFQGTHQRDEVVEEWLWRVLLVGWLVGWLVGCLSGCLSGWLFGRLDGWVGG